MKHWEPDVDLRRLLDALAEELLGASEEDVRRAYREAGRSITGASREVRKLIAAINDGTDAPDPAVPLPDAVRRREPSVRPH